MAKIIDIKTRKILAELPTEKTFESHMVIYPVPKDWAFHGKLYMIADDVEYALRLYHDACMAAVDVDVAKVG